MHITFAYTRGLSPLGYPFWSTRQCTITRCLANVRSFNNRAVLMSKISLRNSRNDSRSAPSLAVHSFGGGNSEHLRRKRLSQSKARRPLPPPMHRLVLPTVKTIGVDCKRSNVQPLRHYVCQQADLDAKERAKSCFSYMYG